jgi:hypothetical protein
MLWKLVAGSGCMAIWRGARAVREKGPTRRAGSRLLDAGRAVFYGFVCWGTASFAAGSGGSSGSDAKSRDWTASALKLPAGQVLVGLVGCVLVGVGVTLAVRAVPCSPGWESSHWWRPSALAPPGQGHGRTSSWLCCAAGALRKETGPGNRTCGIHRLWNGEVRADMYSTGAGT